MSAVDNIAEAIKRHLLANDLSDDHAVEPGLWTTPIERHFIQALRLYGTLGGYGLKIDFGVVTPHANVRVVSQAQVGDWRVDYLLSFFDRTGAARQLIVECDGHDFHAVTKQQVARDRKRDRKAQANGIAIFRFTGSELYKDAWACAEQVVEFISAAQAGGGQ